ncbi:metallophosphoesterase family protein [Candidatus Omnitrophota bacterium]
MSFRRINLKKIILIVVVAAVVYSFLPMIYFWMTEEAPMSDNNQANIDKLKENEGSYFSFIVFGDSHNGLIFNDAASMKLVWHMNREDRFRKVPIDFVLSTGDVSLDDKESHIKAWKKLQTLIKYPVIAGIGNHDKLEFFNEYCGEEEFAFSDRNSYFIVIDNNRGDLTEEQFKWLEGKLKEGREYDHIFVALHKPPYDPYQQEWYNMDNSPWAYKFRKLCGEYNVDMVFSGHKHMFDHKVFDGVDYITTGGGGMLIELPESDGGYLHYVRVMVNNDYVTYEVRKVSPPLWEYVTYYFWKEAAYWVRNWYGSGYIFGRNTKMESLRETRVNEEGYWFGIE